MQLRKCAIMMIVFHLSFAWPLFAQQADRQVSSDIQPPIIAPIVLDEKALASGADISLRVALKNQDHFIYWSWLNSKSFVVRFDQDDEKAKLRNQWQELLGVDVFMPYFKVKEAEEMVANHTKVTLFSMKGKAHFNESKKQVEYIFKKKF